MKIMDALNKLKASVDSANADAAKADTGVQAAGTRLRKIMQQVKADAQAVRNAVLDTREPEPKKKGKK